MWIIGRRNKNRILDAGCGTGYYLKALSENDVFGIDISKGMIWQCRDKNLSNLITASYEFLPFKPGTFDKNKNLERRYKFLAYGRYFNKVKLKVDDITGFNFILTRSDLKRRNEKVLEVFEYIEIENRKKSQKNPIKYLCNEFVIKLIKDKCE